MENIIYEKDYTSKGEIEQESFAARAQDHFWKDTLSDSDNSIYNDVVKPAPKIVNPAGKVQYERLLNRLDTLAKAKGGKIRGVVDFQQYYAEISVVLPSVALLFKDKTRSLFWDIFLSFDDIFITPVDSNHVKLTLRSTHYFIDLLSTEDRESLLSSGNLKSPFLFEIMYKLYDELFKNGGRYE